MMNRTFLMLSIMSFLALVTCSLLMIFNVLNPIIHLKYLLIVFSMFFTFLSLGLFTFREEVSRLQFYLFVVLLILPVFTPLMGLITGEAYAKYWKLFVGGMIFQIGTGIYALVGGFIKKGISTPLKVIAVLNYILFLFMAVVLFFNINVLMEGAVFGVVGGIVTLLSLLIVFLRKTTMSL